MPFYSSSSLSFSNPGVAVEAIEFASLYEAFNPLTTIAKTRFIEWFSGDALDSIWTQTNLSGTGIFAMIDAIDEGFQVESGSTAGNSSLIEFNSINHYDPDNSTQLSITRRATAIGLLQCGFLDTTSFAHFAFYDNASTVSFYRLNVKDGTTSAAIDSSIAVDTIFHSHKLKCIAADVTYFIDGVLEVTRTTNLPNADLQPFFRSTRGASGTNQSRIRYMEIFNT